MRRTVVGLVVALCLPALTAHGQDASGDGGDAPSVTREVSPLASGDRTPRRNLEGAIDDPLVADTVATPTGSSGLIRTYHADTVDPGTFGIFLYTEYYAGSDVVRREDEARRFVGHIGANFAPVDFLEAWVRLSARATTNTLGDPRLIQSVGDLGFGVKGVYDDLGAMSLGLQLNVDVPAGANSVGLDFGAASVDILALATADLRRTTEIPLRIHLNIGYRVDSSEKLFDVRLQRVERFGQNVYDYDTVLFGLGFDAPMRYATPFAEWTWRQPNGAPCDADPLQACVSEEGFSSHPQYLTLGVRSQPVRGFSVQTAMDLGLTTAESQGTPAIPAWNWVFGFGYQIDPNGTGPAEIIEVPIEVPVGEVLSFAEGTVQDAQSGGVIEDARIRYLDDALLADQITGEDGVFRTYGFAPGTEVRFEVSHPDYTSREFTVAIAEEVVSGPLSIEPAFSGALLSGTVTTAGPAEVTVSLRGANNYDIPVVDEAFEMEVEPGTYEVVIHALGYTSEVIGMELAAGRSSIESELRALSPDAVFRRTGDGFAIDDAARGVTFEGDALTEQAQATLDAMAALMEADPALRILVRSHTDMQEDDAAELDLTAARAAAVQQYLVAAGVSADRLETDAVGSAEPRYPNVTARGRRLNNRVEFQVIRSAPAAEASEEAAPEGTAEEAPAAADDAEAAAEDAEAATAE